MGNEWATGKHAVRQGCMEAVKIDTQRPDLWERWKDTIVRCMKGEIPTRKERMLKEGKSKKKKEYETTNLGMRESRAI